MGADVLKYPHCDATCPVVYFSITKSSARNAEKSSGRIINKGDCGNFPKGSERDFLG